MKQSLISNTPKHFLNRGQHLHWHCSSYTDILSFHTTIPNLLGNFALQRRHNGRDSVSNHQPHDCLLTRLFSRSSKKTSKLRVTCLCAGDSPGTGEFPVQMASCAENVSIWWRHQGNLLSKLQYSLNVFYLEYSTCKQLKRPSRSRKTCILDLRIFFLIFKSALMSSACTRVGRNLTTFMI